MKATELKEIVDTAWDSDEEKERRKKTQRFIKEYNGIWWNEQNLTPEDSRVVCNFVFSTVQTLMPLLTDNKPIWNVVAREYYMQRIANRWNKALEALWSSQEMDYVQSQIIIDMLIGGTGIYKTYFDPSLAEGLGDVTIEAVDPLDFVVSPGYNDLWKCAWCGTKRKIPAEFLMSRYPKYKKELKEQIENNELGRNYQQDEKETRYLGKDVITVYEIWLRDEETEKVLVEVDERVEDSEKTTGEEKELPKYPYGRIVTFTGGDKPIILEDRPSPFKHGKPPYVMVIDYFNPHRIYGMGDVEQVEQLNREYNLRLQQLVEHIRKHTKINYVVDAGAGIKTDKIKQAIAEGDHVLESQAGFAKDVLVPLGYPEPPSILGTMLQILPKMIEEITGVTDISKGIPSKNERQTASETSILIESSHTRIRQKVRNIEHSLKRLCTLVLSLMQQYYTENRTIKYPGEENEVGYTNVTNNAQIMKDEMKPPLFEDYLQGNIDEKLLTPDEKTDYEDYKKLLEYLMDKDEIYINFDIEIQTNSTLPLDKQSLANLMLRLAQMKIVDPQAVIETLRLPNGQKIIQRFEQMQQQQMQMQQQGGANASITIPPNPGQ